MAKPAFYSAKGVMELVDVLASMSHHVEELGCTCAERPSGRHRKDCTGMSLARHGYQLVSKWNKRLAADLKGTRP